LGRSGPARLLHQPMQVHCKSASVTVNILIVPTFCTVRPQRLHARLSSTCEMLRPACRSAVTAASNFLFQLGWGASWQQQLQHTSHIPQHLHRAPKRELRLGCLHKAWEAEAAPEPFARSAACTLMCRWVVDQMHVRRLAGGARV